MSNRQDNLVRSDVISGRQVVCISVEYDKVKKNMYITLHELYRHDVYIGTR